MIKDVIIEIEHKQHDEGAAHTEAHDRACAQFHEEHPDDTTYIIVSATTSMMSKRWDGQYFRYEFTTKIHAKMY